MRYKIMASASFRIDKTQITNVKSMPKRTRARRVLFSAKIFTLSKNCMNGDESSVLDAFSPPGSRSMRMTEYNVIALTT